ncbi:MAG: phoD-like phosphatase family protein, partial [Massilia sp.]|nr:phoD-like phosphatase family protein [Massilia sp.]
MRTKKTVLAETAAPDTGRRRFVIRMASVAAVLSTGGVLSACGSPNPLNGEMAAFNYGVASGDPLSDRVILWTHAKISTEQAVPLTWQMSADAGFATVVATGTTSATADSGFTAKVDAAGLAANTEYFYRFIAPNNSVSPVGRTRTLPVGNVAEVKLAVFSCSDYPAGYFNA